MHNATRQASEMHVDNHKADALQANPAIAEFERMVIQEQGERTSDVKNTKWYANKGVGVGEEAG